MSSIVHSPVLPIRFRLANSFNDYSHIHIYNFGGDKGQFTPVENRVGMGGICFVFLMQKLVEHKWHQYIGSTAGRMPLDNIANVNTIEKIFNLDHWV